VKANLKNKIEPSATDNGVRAFNIGRKIRKLRKGKALTLQNLSTSTGLSKPLLSQIENELVVPPISTLLKISRALEKDITFFFQEPDNDGKVVVVRPFERERLDTKKLGRTDGGYSYESLAYKKTRKNMEPFLIEFERKDEKDLSFYSHEGEEFLFVLEGNLEFRTEAYRAVGKRNAKAIAVVFSTP
jgi:transcriptional regulator with XRE-family HTH domain